MEKNEVVGIFFLVFSSVCIAVAIRVIVMLLRWSPEMTGKREFIRRQKRMALHNSLKR